MPATGNEIAAALFSDTDTADEAWSLLVDADIPAAVITDPGTFGTPFTVSVMVERKHLDAAQEVLAPFMKARGLA